LALGRGGAGLAREHELKLRVISAPIRDLFYEATDMKQTTPRYQKTAVNELKALLTVDLLWDLPPSRSSPSTAIKALRCWSF